MKTTIKAFLHYHKYDWQDNPTYEVFPNDMSTIGPQYVLIKKIDVEVEIPDNFDPRPQQVAALRKEKQNILSETNVKVANIDEQIQKLLCIENKE